MAMEKLILRSVMYGVDKIPDAWFEKVPGGYYKSKQKVEDKIGGEDGGKKQRRNSHNHDDRRRTRRDRYEDEQRAEDKKRQEKRGRSAYDGSHDDDFGDEPHSRRQGGRRQRRHSVDSDRYGHRDGYSSAPSNAYYADRKYRDARQPCPPDPYFDERQRPVTSESSGSTKPSHSKNAGLAGAAAAERGAQQPQPGSTSMPSPQMRPTQTPSTDRPPSTSAANGYVPYAHLYGQPESRPQPAFPPPPTSVSGHPQASFPAEPSSISPSEQNYPQNPFAQRISTAEAGQGVQSSRHPAFAPPPGSPTSARAFAGYENRPPYPETPRPSRAAHRYSPSYASDDRYDSDVRRTRSERRPDKPDGGRNDRAKDTYVDPRAPLHGQRNAPTSSSGPATGKDSRRDSAYEHDRRRSHRHNDRGYTSD